MPFALNGTTLQRARVTVPRLGVWDGTCTTAGVLDVAVGTGVTLQVGDLTLTGYVVAGGTFAGATESTYTLAGGAAGWSRMVPARGFNAPQGAKLVDVVQQLAADAGEQFDLSTISPQTVLGDHWQRPAGVASAALSALFPLSAGGWRLDPDGYARPGQRPAFGLPASLQYAVEDAPRDRRWARIGIANDQVSAFLPGAIVTAPNMSAPIVVGSLVIRAEVDRVVVEVFGEAGLVEMIAAIVQALTPAPPLLGEYRYQVDSDSSSGANLRALSAGVPTLLGCAKSFGLPGCTATLAAGSVVLVAFADGNPARPIITGYVSGTPLTAALDATTVNLGPTPGPLAKPAPIVTWAALVGTALAAAGYPVAALGPIDTTAVFGS